MGSEGPILIGALVIAAIWGVYLFPSLFGNRKEAPLSSTEEFDKWTHVMADVQRRGFNARRSSERGVVRTRRRRTLLVLISAAAGALVIAYVQRSTGWLLVHLTVDALIALYVAMLMQIKQNQIARAAREHAMDRTYEEPVPVRIVAGS